MPNYLSDEDCLAAVRAVEQHGTKQAAADTLGIASSTLKDRLRTASRRGLSGTAPVLEGFEISKISTTLDDNGSVVREHIQQKPERGEGQFNVPEGHRIKGVSALVDGNGNVLQQWYKTREGDLDPLWVVDTLHGSFVSHKR